MSRKAMVALEGVPHNMQCHVAWTGFMVVARGLFLFSLPFFLCSLRAWPKVETVSGLGKVDERFEDSDLG